MSKLFAMREKQPGIKIFVTSRGILDIVQSFKECASCEILASDGDIERYVEGNMSSLLPKFVERKPDLQEEIKVGISCAVGGM
jgi:hypothetical protein